MFTENQVIRGMRLMESPTGYLSATSSEKRIASLLEEAMDNGEFDGELAQAIEYLQGQGYVIELEESMGCECEECQ